MRPERDDALSRALDRLYAGPLEDFVAARRALATELRAQGDAAAAQAVAAAAKPTRTAWALNQVARSNPASIRALLEARDAAAAAQKRGSADELRAATRDYRMRVADVVREVRGVLEEAGAQASATQLRRIGETLQAAASVDSDARAQLVAGRLARDVDVEDPFAGLVAGPPRGALQRPRPREREATPSPPPRSSPREDLARQRAAERERAQREAAREAATKRVAALEEAAREARAAARAAETAAMRAQDEAHRARRDSEQAEARLQKAREELRSLRA